MPPFEPNALSGLQPPSGCAEVNAGCLQQEMIVVWHQAVGVDNHAKLRHCLLGGLQKPHAVRIIAINRLAFVASGRNMINGVGRFRSDWPCHSVKITAADDNRQVSRVDPIPDAEICGGGIVVSRRFWRRFAKQGSSPLSAGQLSECQQRIDFVLGEVDFSEVVEGRWLEIPELSQAERAKLEAARVAEPCERLQALAEAFEAGLFDFVVQLLACSYSRYGRRPHHPLLLLKVWLAMLSVGSSSPGGFLRAVDDSLQLRLFL